MHKRQFAADKGTHGLEAYPFYVHIQFLIALLRPGGFARGVRAITYSTLWASALASSAK
jgi:hypothetical protein